MIDLEQSRLVIWAMANTAQCRGDFVVLREVIMLSGIGTVAERESVIAEWIAEYHEWAYDVWPHGHQPRPPRPQGLAYSEDE